MNGRFWISVVVVFVLPMTIGFVVHGILQGREPGKPFLGQGLRFGTALAVLILGVAVAAVNRDPRRS